EGSVVRTGLDAELLARGVVQRDDLASYLGALIDRSARPRHAQLFGDADAGDLPDAAIAGEGGHDGVSDLQLGCRGECARDEEVVVAMVVIHVTKDGGDHVAFEDMSHDITVRRR